ncbi:hypothetical protein ILYODFUR_037617 [Ilyodon furcidens]|uniref:Uncharacterized protein n=1 Tax=Ilyodon furcidens TaxID=33524 RepID=A0ABV0VKC5_9TELE
MTIRLPQLGGCPLQHQANHLPLNFYRATDLTPQGWYTHLPGGGATAGVSNQQPAVRPKLTNQSTGVHDQQLQYRTPAPQPHDGGVDAQHTPEPPIRSPYRDQYAAPPLTGMLVEDWIGHAISPGSNRAPTTPAVFQCGASSEW